MKSSRGKKAISYSNVQATGRRLVLRPYTFLDFKTLRRSFEERLPPINRFDEPVAATKETELKRFKERVLRYRRDAKEQQQFVFGAFDKKSGAFIGQIDFFVINKQLRWANLGYNIGNQYWNQGYATEAAQLGLKIAFNVLNFHRIEAATEIRNKPSQKVALKCGLLREGKRIKFFPDDGGIDMVVFGQNAIDYR